jgi:hypothetical protein
MAALGDIEPVDAAIHADTGYEAEWTYRFAEKWAPWLEERGVKVITANNDNSQISISRGGGKIYIPAYTNGAYGNKTESQGQLRRQCTIRWKIQPIRRWLQTNRNEERVTQLIGISTDEWQRMKDSDVKYITNAWPLIEKRMSRKDCEKYLNDHSIEIPHKSACYFCPYHNTAGWIEIMHSIDAKKAIEIDKIIRNARKGFTVYVHPARKPLEDIDFRTLQEKGQMELWDAECSGICGV